MTPFKIFGIYILGQHHRLPRESYLGMDFMTTGKSFGPSFNEIDSEMVSVHPMTRNYHSNTLCTMWGTRKGCLYYRIYLGRSNKPDYYRTTKYTWNAFQIKLLNHNAFPNTISPPPARKPTANALYDTVRALYSHE